MYDDAERWGGFLIWFGRLNEGMVQVPHLGSPPVTDRPDILYIYIHIYMCMYIHLYNKFVRVCVLECRHRHSYAQTLYLKTWESFKVHDFFGEEGPGPTSLLLGGKTVQSPVHSCLVKMVQGAQHQCFLCYRICAIPELATVGFTYLIGIIRDTVRLFYGSILLQRVLKESTEAQNHFSK
jgi:hypothetical protein